LLTFAGSLHIYSRTPDAHHKNNGIVLKRMAAARIYRAHPDLAGFGNMPAPDMRRKAAYVMMYDTELQIECRGGCTLKDLAPYKPAYKLVAKTALQAELFAAM